MSDSACNAPCADGGSYKCGCADAACGGAAPAPGEELVRRWVVYELPVRPCQLPRRSERLCSHVACRRAMHRRRGAREMQRRRRSGRRRRRRANRTFKMRLSFRYACSPSGGRTPPCRDRCGCAFAAQRKPAAPALALLRHRSRFSRPVLGGRHPSFARSLRFLRRTAGARQTGQMEDRVSHRRMHSRWNTWAQRRTTTPAPSSPPSSSSQTTAQRQTAHEAALAAALRQLGCTHRSFR